ncbi:hypothetical protein [Singulisphaera sp. GP187]|nr:hypothetical protein [Singulisphaera sp. GP187]
MDVPQAAGRGAGGGREMAKVGVIAPRPDQFVATRRLPSRQLAP